MKNMSTIANAGTRGANTSANNSNNRNWRTSGCNNRHTPRAQNSTSKFKGTVLEMNGHVFQCYGKVTEKKQFARTMEELDGYIGLHFKSHPADIKKLIKVMENTKIPMPNDHTNNAAKTEVRIWEKEVDWFVKQRETYISNKCALYSVI
jgi:hypothetical protein